MFLDVLLAVLLVFFLIIHFLHLLPLPNYVFVILSIVGVIPVLISAVKALINRKLTIDLLASIALLASLLARDWYAASFINLMLVSARIFDRWTDNRSKQIIQKLLKYRPEKVKVKRGTNEVNISISQVKTGDEVVVEVGERIPVDGVIISGQASLNQATLTGESEPVTKKVGDKVYTSTLNESGSLVIRAEKVGEDTRFSQIVLLVEEASRAKSVSEKIADRFTQWYIVASFVGAVLLYILTHNTQLILAVLLVVCADDIAVSIPLSFTAAISEAARRGFLVKGSQVLENLAKVSYFFTDKTGTLTFGKPQIKEVYIPQKLSKSEILSLLGTASVNSSHPVSRAMIKYLEDLDVKVISPDDFQESPGEGIITSFKKHRLITGKLQFLQDHGIVVTASQRKIVEKAWEDGFGITALGEDKKLLALITFEDKIRPSALEVVKKTKQLGVKTWIMLTGDNPKTAARVTRELGIDGYESNVTPEGKFKFIKNFQNTHSGVIAMIGDGVNDAAALALADVSIAMGLIGSEATIEASDVAIMNDSLTKIPQAMLLGKNVMNIVKQNFWIWGITNIIGLVLVFTGVLNPVGASTYNFLTDFIPIFNALRLL